MKTRISSISFKNRVICALWFGLSGFIAAVMRIEISSSQRSGELITNNEIIYLATLIAFIMGFAFGQKILSLAPRKKNVFKAAAYGFLGGILSLLIFDLILSLFMDYRFYIYCHYHHIFSCHEFFKDIGKLHISILLISLAIGWHAIVIGAISSLCLFAFNAYYLQNHLH